jgi:hypothetical protein
MDVEPSLDQLVWIRYLSSVLSRKIATAVSNGAEPDSYTVNIKFVSNADGTPSEIKTAYQQP